jgi:trehalose-6-phosphate synthase
MRLRFRLIISLILGITTVSLLFTLSQVRAEKRGLRAELEKRAQILAESLGVAVAPFLNEAPTHTLPGPGQAVTRRSRLEIQRLLDRFGNRERLAGVAVYDDRHQPIALTPGLAAQLPAVADLVNEAMKQDKGAGRFLWIGSEPLHVYVLPLERGGSVAGALAIFHDTAYIASQSSGIWRSALKSVLLQTILIISVTLLIVNWSIAGPIARIANWVRETRAGKYLPAPDLPEEDVFKVLTREVRNMAASLAAARAAAQEEARLRDAVESTWTAERLGVHVRGRLEESKLLVISNREPYSHVHGERSIETVVPASGLVTALEPILEACDGTWIAHGSGNADTEVVDEHDRLRVPPDHPRYTLRRVWLGPQEEEGYYFGFANEGLWPLCHIAFARPTFRAGDWGYYQEVNKKFAKVVLEEIEGIEHPMILAQDYHFALLPRLVKEKRPDVRVAIFWHIPWPNPQAFGICPWQRELLDGLLGADLIGFHIQSHCNHFLETVDATLESVIDWEHFAVNRLGHRTLVKPFPISVAFPENAPEESSNGSKTSLYLERAEIFKQFGVESAFMGIGVDRVDYTKGIPERLRGIERFLEKHPSYIGQFTFLQVGAPSRTQIQRYRDLFVEVDNEAERINARFQTGKWRPIVLLKRHHSHIEIEKFYKAADVCMVTSLHDGMNLVAKEFVAARNDDQGALILSPFTGAARQLSDAIMVNPYDTEQLAESIRFALEMAPEERRARMRRMRAIVKEHNVYRWAANLVTELSEIRLDKLETVRER